MKKKLLLVSLAFTILNAFDAKSQCFKPLYPTGNMIADPEFNQVDLSSGGYGGWGTRSITTTTTFCGDFSFSINGNCGGSLDRALTQANGNALKPYTAYKVRAMVNNTGTTGQFQFEIAGVNNNASNFWLVGPTNGWKQVDYTFFTDAVVTQKGIYFNSCGGARANGIGYLDNYEMYEIPGIHTSISEIKFDKYSKKKSFIISYSSATEGMAQITSPAGITMSTNSISNYQGILLTASWDGTTNVAGNIKITDGNYQVIIPITASTANTSCYTSPSNLNLVADPEFNAVSLSTGEYLGWGTRSIDSASSIAYCGTRCGKVSFNPAGVLNGTNSGSIDVSFTEAKGNSWKTNTTYTIKAKVWATDGTFPMGVKHNNGSNEFTFNIPKSDTWIDFEKTFITGESIGNDPRVFFNNAGSCTGTTGYIDNWQVFETPDPVLISTVDKLGMNESHFSEMFIVSGQNLTGSLLTITCPEGITAEPNSISIINGNIPNIGVNITYDKLREVNGMIRLDEGSKSVEIPVMASNNDCDMPLLVGVTNLMPDPQMNTLTGYTSSWKRVGIALNEEAYCGNRCGKITGLGLCWDGNGGSITTPNITWTPFGKYHMRAMVKTFGTFNIGVGNTYADEAEGQAAYNMTVPDTQGEWVVFDQTFNTGSEATAGQVYFNNCEGATGLIGYIDNWELYEISTLTNYNQYHHAANKVYLNEGSIVLDIFVEQSADVKITVYNVQGMQLNTENKYCIPGNNVLNLNVSLPAGIYFIKLTGTNKDEVFKIIK